jgi:uncharacterized protein YaaW (UPF0174 family)
MPPKSNSERTAILETEVSNLKEDNRDTQKILLDISNQTKELAIRQTSTFSIIEALPEKIDSAIKSTNERLDKAEAKISNNITNIAKLSVRQKIMYGVGAFFLTSIVTIVIKVIYL